MKWLSLLFLIACSSSELESETPMLSFSPSGVTPTVYPSESRVAGLTLDNTKQEIGSFDMSQPVPDTDLSLLMTYLAIRDVSGNATLNISAEYTVNGVTTVVSTGTFSLTTALTNTSQYALFPLTTLLNTEKLGRNGTLKLYAQLVQAQTAVLSTVETQRFDVGA